MPLNGDKDLKIKKNYSGGTELKGKTLVLLVLAEW